MSSGRCASSGSGRSRSTPRPTATRLHVVTADEAYLIGPGPASESYLRGDRIVEAALRAGAEAVHPGYGFLAENAAFAREVAAGGPHLDRAAARGDRGDGLEDRGARAHAGRRRADHPGDDGARRETSRTVARGGGRDRLPDRDQGVRRGWRQGAQDRSAPEGELERAFESATREGEAYFADAAVYVERYLEDPRHVEVQVLADEHGTVVHLGERDCTIQRRHQKLVEETPSPAVDDELRERIGRIAVDAARAVGYRSAGTIEGLLTPDGSYYFLEMNTRVQVEHTVTEAVTGIDIVREQVLIAAGEPLSFTQEDVVLRGHAIECRINAEDVTQGFLPSPGLDHGVPRARRDRRARRLGRSRGRRGLGALRPDDREARRARRRPRAGAAAGCCARSRSS